jgi:ribonuclease BN (tRNA processing enzyme)
MEIKFYGVRGSYPVPGSDTVEFGGNTTCVSFSRIVNEKPYRVIVDSGTGIITLGREIIKNYLKHEENMNIHIFFTHLHPDHTQGFPFFGPNFFKSAEVNLYGMGALGSDIEQILSSQMTPPNFPIEYRSLKSNRKHRILEDGDKVQIGISQDETYFTVEVMQAFAPSHPQQGALYYKIMDTSNGKKVACIWDNESKIGGDQAVINFIRGCDILIHDAQYTEKEYASNERIVQGFGHSTHDMAINVALQAGVKTVICTHYDPNHSDGTLKIIEKEIRESYWGSGMNIIFAKEGMVYTP